VTKKCPHCDGEIMPSVVKCRHCGRNVKDAPEDSASGAPEVTFEPAAVGAPPAAPPEAAPSQTAIGTATAVASPPAQPQETRITIEDPPPPAGISFTPAVAKVAPTGGEESPSDAEATDASASKAASQPAPPPTATPSAEPPAKPEPEDAAPAGNVQDWGPPTDPGKLDPYWQEKVVPPDAGDVSGSPAKPRKESAGLLGNVSILFVLLGGVIAAVTSMQGWVQLEVSGIKGIEDSTELIAGTTRWEGRLTMALAVVCVVAALLAFSRRDSAPLKGMVVPALGILVTVGYTLANLTTEFTDDFVTGGTIKGMSEQAARGQVTTWIDTGQLTLTTQYALYLLAGAGLVILVGAILAFLARKPVTRGVVVTHSGSRLN